MTDDAYERYLDDFGRQLEQAAADVRPAPRRRVRLAIATAAVTAVAVAVLLATLLAPSGGRRLDVLAEARAALSPRDEILHIIIRQSSELPRTPPRGVHFAPSSPQTIEQWSATRPLRWRLVTTYPGSSRAGGSVFDSYGRIVGRVQTSRAPGVAATYVERRKRIRVVTGLSERVSPPGIVPPGTSSDPLTTIRAALADGRLRAAGVVRANGREVRRLTGVLSRQHGGRRVIYDVDPETSVPVTARVFMPVGSRSGGTRTTVVVVIRFLRYEHLPLNAETEGLLDIQASPRTPTTRMTAAEARREAERRLPQTLRGLARQRR